MASSDPEVKDATLDLEEYMQVYHPLNTAVSIVEYMMLILTI